MLLQVAYVRADKEVKALERFEQDGGAFAIALPGAEGRALRAKSMDTAHIKRLKEQRLQLRVKLLLPVEPAENSPQYQAALRCLAEEEVMHVQGLIEKEVSGIAALRTERVAAGAACKQSRSVDKRLQRRRRRVRQHLAVLAAWRKEPAAHDSEIMQMLPQTWAEDAVLEVFKGVFPWRLNNSTHPALAHLAVQYRDALTEVSDTSEADGG